MGKMPSWHKGKLIYCDVCGWFYGSREGKITKQEGRNVCPDCRDRITEKQRNDMIQRRIR